jgi:hypothetical protein
MYKLITVALDTALLPPPCALKLMIVGRCTPVLRNTKVPVLMPLDRPLK